MGSAVRVTVVGVFLFMLAGCGNSELPKAAEAVREKIQQDEGVFTVEFGNRFGTDVIIVGCVTNDDRNRIRNELGGSYSGFEIHYVAPIWGLAGLDSVNKATMEKMLQDSRYMTAGTEQWNQRQKFSQQATEKDAEIWRSWSTAERRRWLREFISMQREINPQYANCGDKFLKAE